MPTGLSPSCAQSRARCSWPSPGREELRLLKLRLGIPGSSDPPEHVDPARVGDSGETELLHVFPVLIVSGPGKVLGPDVSVEPVRQRVVDGLHVAARSARRLEHRNLVATLHQFVRTATPADASAGHDDSLTCPAYRTYRCRGFVCRKTCDDSRGGKLECLAPIQALAWAIIQRAERVGFSHLVISGRDFTRRADRFNHSVDDDNKVIDWVSTAQSARRRSDACPRSPADSGGLPARRAQAFHLTPRPEPGSRRVQYLLWAPRHRWQKDPGVTASHRAGSGGGWTRSYTGFLVRETVKCQDSRLKDRCDRAVSKA